MSTARAVGPPVVPVGGPVVLPRDVDPYRQRGRTFLIVLVALSGVVGVAAVIFLSVSAGRPAGTGLVLTYALMPVPFLVAGYWWLDRYEPEPRRYKWAAFVWGGVGAVIIALAAQLAVDAIWHLSDEHMATFIAPVTEEPAKGLFLLLTFVRSRRVLDGFVDALVYAGLVGLGFAFMENIGYYAGSYLGEPDIPLKGAEGATATFVVRGLFSPLAHPLFTSAFAISLALALRVRNRALKVLIAVVGLGLSATLHGVWNGSLSYGGGQGFVLAYLGLGVVLFFLLICAVIARVQQGQQLARALHDVARRGWLHPDEVPFVAKFTERRRARQFAKARIGAPAADAFTRYQQMAVTMAFLHDGVMTGRCKPQAVGRVDALRLGMGRLKPYVSLPAPRRPVPGWGHPPAWGQQALNGQPPPYVRPPVYGQPPPYVRPPVYGQPPPYARPPVYGQPPNRQPPVYGRPPPYGQPTPYRQPPVYGQPQPYGQPAANGQRAGYGQAPVDGQASPPPPSRGPDSRHAYRPPPPSR